MSEIVTLMATPQYPPPRRLAIPSLAHPSHTARTTHALDTSLGHNSPASSVAPQTPPNAHGPGLVKVTSARQNRAPLRLLLSLMATPQYPPLLRLSHQQLLPRPFLPSLTPLAPLTPLSPSSPSPRTSRPCARPIPMPALRIQSYSVFPFIWSNPINWIKCSCDL